jgi:hypothetical protein
MGMPWADDAPAVTLVTPEGERALAATAADGRLRVDVPALDPYALLVLDPA